MATADNVSPDEPKDGGEGEINWYKQQLGRQANELGELRRTLDDYILKQDEVDVYSAVDEDTLKVVEREIEKRVKPIKEQLNQSSANQAVERLKQVHADYESVVTDPKFNEWVEASRVRRAAYESAVSGDIDTGIDLLTEFKSSRPAQRDNLNVAMAQNRGGSGDTGAKESTIYKRTDIIRKKMEDPAWYRDNQQDIMRAYAEGRVR